MGKLLKFLRSLRETIIRPRYIIVHDPRFGYAACELDDLGTYYTITKHGTTGVSLESAKDPFYGNGAWVASEEEAGKRINFRDDASGQRVVWP